MASQVAGRYGMGRRLVHAPGGPVLKVCSLCVAGRDCLFRTAMHSEPRWVRIRFHCGPGRIKVFGNGGGAEPVMFVQIGYD